jgi:hypothetical protein
MEPTGPVIKLRRDRSNVRDYFFPRSRDGDPGYLVKLTKAVEFIPYDDDKLYWFLHLRIEIDKEAQHRSAWFGGRFYNWVTGQQPGYIPVSGSHLRQTLDAARINLPDTIDGLALYQLRCDVAERARAELKRKCNISHPTS